MYQMVTKNYDYFIKIHFTFSRYIDNNPLRIKFPISGCHEFIRRDLGAHGVGANNAATQAASQTPKAVLHAANAGTAAI